MLQRLAAAGMLLLGITTVRQLSVIAQRDVLVLARNSLGDARTLAEVRTIRAEGTVERLDRKFTYAVAVAFPNQYRVDYSGELKLTAGFSATDLINPVLGTYLTPNEVLQRNHKDFMSLRHEASVLMLGMLLKPLPERRLTFAPVLNVGAPVGRGVEVLAVTGDDGFNVRLSFDRGTNLPVRVSWDGADILWPGQGPPVGDRRQMEATIAKLPVVRHELIFTDRKPVSGIKIPFSVTHESGGRVYEKFSFDMVEINSVIEPSYFVTVK